MSSLHSDSPPFGRVPGLTITQKSGKRGYFETGSHDNRVPFHVLLGYRDADIAAMLENPVFLELKRRGYEVFIGKFGTKEIDFIATKRENYSESHALSPFLGSKGQSWLPIVLIGRASLFPFA